MKVHADRWFAAGRMMGSHFAFLKSRLAMSFAAVLVVWLALPTNTRGAVTVAGELVVDLRAVDLNGSSNTWTNRDVAGNTVGNFNTYGGGNLNVASVAGQTGLYVNAFATNALLSASNTPASLEGNSTCSVEAWLYAETYGSSQSPVSWGLFSPADGSALREFRYHSADNNGLFSGWFGNDYGWTTDPAVGAWVHVAWVYNGSTLKSYVNGVLNTTTAAFSPALNTPDSVLRIGMGRPTGGENFDGYIADVRIHTGVLSDADVLNNYNQGIYTSTSVAPVITGLNNQTVAPGGNLLLNPTVTGSAPIYYQWRENGANLPDQTNATLTLLNVQLSQDGYVYSLVASNSAGAVTNSMTLTVANVQLTLNLDINTSAGNNYTGTALAQDTGTFWNSFVVPAASSLTLANVRDSSNNVTASSITINRISGSNFSSWDNTGGGGNPNPVALMRDYLFSGPYGVTISNLPAGTYALFAYAHGDNTGQASTVTLNAANGGAGGSTTDVGEYRNLYQAGAEGNSYLKLTGTVGGSGTFAFTTTYLNGFQLQLLSAPVISGLTNRTVIAGTSPVLSPAIAGIPTPAFQWRSNTVAIAGATNSSLVLNNVQYEQNGAVYSLVASNLVGTVTNSMTLTVIVTPGITGLNNQAAPVGATVTISPTVSGVPAPATRWLFGGNNLSDGATGNGSTISGSATSTLVINNAQAADSGIYSLVATNSAGMVTNSMTLTVSSGNVAPNLTGPADQTVVQTSNATFSASVSGLPVPDLQWRLNGTNIPGATGSSLTLTNVQYSQNGFVYSLVASNSAGMATNSAQLFVLVPPVISQQPTNLSVVAGTSAGFSVSASGVPAVKYQWSKNGSPIANATNAAYTIAIAQGADNGSVFSVTVSNSISVVTSSNATLTVLSTMTGTLLPTNGAVNISPDQQLRIVFSSAPKIGAGKLYVRDAANDSVFATIDTSLFQTFTMFGATITNAYVRTVQGSAFYYMPIAIYGNEAWITLNSSNRLAYNKTYYVNADAGLFLDSSNASFPAITGTNTWRISTKSAGLAAPTASTGPTNLTVALDGAGDFATLQGASDWVPQNNTLKRTITVQPGTYRDFTIFAQNRNNVQIIGGGAKRQDTQLIYLYPAYNNGNGAGTLRLESSDIYVRNLTLDNQIYFTNNGVVFAGPIQTLITTGSRLIFDNVLIKGGQDTLYTISGITYFNRCEIWGSVDYIYGAALSVFDQCDIVEIRNTGGPITAPNTDLAAPYGLTFLNCNFPRALIANGYPYDVGTGNTTMQRPWRQDGYTALINCAVGSQISTKGWGEWDGRETTCRALESGTTLIGGGTVTPAQRQAAGAYWLNTIDPDYVNDPSLNPTNALLFGSPGTNNRVAVTINTNDFTLPAIFGHPYFNLGGWLPTLIPTITSQPTNQTVNAGGTANFGVTAIGMPNPMFQWLKNGTNFPGATNATLTITNAQAGDTGTYSVLVANSAGAVTSSNATLTVVGLTAPAITTQPTNQTAAQGGNASFTVVATGVPAPTYQWLKNTLPISNATNATLTLNNVQVTDIAVYSVIVSNSVNSVTSSNATFNLSGPNGFCMVNGSTTGGAGGTVVTVSNTTDFVTQVGIAGPRIIQVQGVIRINAGTSDGRTFCTANKTIIGLGTNAMICGDLWISGVTNVIVQNLRVSNSGNDGLTIWNAQHVWVDHCTFYDCVDGLCDMNNGSQYVTLSWCKFHYVNQPNHRFSSIADGYTNTTTHAVTYGYYTLHHNWWSTGCYERLGSSSYGRLHYYDNYWSCTNNYYATLARVDTQILSQNNYYSGVNNPLFKNTGNPDEMIQSSGNIYSGCTGTIDGGSDTVFNPAYGYLLDNTVDVPGIVMAGAGAPGPDTLPIPPKIWDGGGSDNKLSTAGNWAPNDVPGYEDTLIFSGGTRTSPTNDLYNDIPNGKIVEFNNIIFSNTASAFVLGGKLLSVGSSIEDFSPAAQTVNLPVQLNYAQDRLWSNRVFNVSSAAGSLVINGNMSGSTNAYFTMFGLTKQGPGLLTLNGTNSFPAVWQMDGGLVQFKTLDTNQPGSLGDGNMINFNGGGLRWAAGNTADISARAINIQSGGATLDSGAGDIVLSLPIGNNGSGGLTKTGSGKITLNGNNTYSGATLIAQGALALGLDGLLTNSPQLILSNNATLDVSGRSDGTQTLLTGKLLAGNGTIRGSVIASSGSTIAPGFSTGTLVITNTLTFQSGCTNVMQLDQLAHTNDLITGMVSVNYGGRLVLTNVSGTLTNGDSFKLFSAGSYYNAFSSIAWPALGGNLVWTNKLAIDGTIAVISPVNTTPTNLVLAVVGNQLQLSWPADHTGWRLEVQTNSLATGLSAQWFTVPGSTGTNQMWLPISPGNASVFYRLAYQ